MKHKKVLLSALGLIFSITLFGHTPHKVSQEEIDAFLRTYEKPHYSKKGPRKYILSGAPSVGKTSIVNALEQYHHEYIIHETPTDVISLKVAEGEEPPWARPEVTVDILKTQMLRESRIHDNPKGRIFLDKSLLDSLAYQVENKSESYTLNMKTALDTANNPTFSKTVFVVESMGKYTENEVRDGSLEVSKQIHEAVVHNYEIFGFNVVLVKPGTVKERAAQVLKVVKEEEKVLKAQ